MANKRMIAKMIVDSDAFLDMPQSTQNLYFHLNLRADDDGFIDNPKRIMQAIGSNQNDLDILLAKRYLLGFSNGVIVIKHWRLHNCIQRDRYKPTVYKEQFENLAIKDNGAYTDNKSIQDNTIKDCIQDVNSLDPECYIDQIRSEIDIDKKSIKIEPENEIITLPVLTDLEPEKTLSPMKDELANNYQILLTAQTPFTVWGDIAKERQQLNTLAKKTRAIFKDGVPFDDTFQLSDAILATFLEMREFGHWRAKDKPVIPSSVSTAWAEIITQLAESYRTVESVGIDEEIIF